jgi:hypothetical protein
MKRDCLNSLAISPSDVLRLGPFASGTVPTSWQMLEEGPMGMESYQINDFRTDEGFRRSWRNQEARLALRTSIPDMSKMTS